MNGSQQNPAPLVSILITAYNREAFLAEAIDSALRSTYAPVEVIVVDDASTDRTAEIALDFARRDPRVRVFRNEQNLGDYPNRNYAATLAGGKYLKYLDSDDVLFSHSIARLVEALERYPSAALAVPNFGADAGEPVLFSPRQAYRRHFFEMRLLDCGPSACLVRADAFRRDGPFSGKRNVSDFELWLRLAARHAVVAVRPDLLFYREHEGQESRLGEEAYLEHTLAVMRTILRDPACPLGEIERRAVIERTERQTARQCLAYAWRRQKPWRALRLLWRNRVPLRQIYRVLTGR